MPIQFYPRFRRAIIHGVERVVAYATTARMVHDERLGMTQDKVNELVSKGGGIIGYDQIYPVGVQLETADDAFDPAQAFGGEWENVPLVEYATKTELEGKADKADLMEQSTMSTEEHWTGEYYLDGSKIYEKTIMVNVSNNTEVYTPHNIANLGSYRVIDVGKSMCAAAGDVYFPVSFFGGTTTHFIRAFWRNTQSEIAAECMGYGPAVFTVVLRYTCTDR